MVRDSVAAGYAADHFPSNEEKRTTDANNCNRDFREVVSSLVGASLKKLLPVGFSTRVGSKHESVEAMAGGRSEFGLPKSLQPQACGADGFSNFFF